MTDDAQEIAYDLEVLSVLVWELTWTATADAERKIKRRLREKGLGQYDQARIDALRRLRNGVAKELGKRVDSAFCRPASACTGRRGDWDADGLILYLAAEHPDVSSETIRAILPYVLHIYYER